MILSIGKPRKTYGLRLSEDEAARLDRVAAVFDAEKVSLTFAKVVTEVRIEILV